MSDSTRCPPAKSATFVAIGVRGPVIVLKAMHGIRRIIRNCSAPLGLDEAGHFTPEWSEPFIDCAVPVFATTQELHSKSEIEFAKHSLRKRRDFCRNAKIAATH